MTGPNGENRVGCCCEDAVALPGVWHGTISYDGTGYHGWQIQPGVRTVQGEITSRLRRLFNDDSLRIGGTSRTDAGVHALDQHFSFPDLHPGRFEEERLRFQLRRWLPSSICLVDLRLEEPGFHARHSACGKAYTYAVSRGEASSPFETPFVWHCTHPLNLVAMREAASALVGTHDFTSLSANSKQKVDMPVKTIHRLEVIEDDGGDRLFFNVVGTSFLYKMVRSIVGYLILNAGRDPAWRAGKLEAMLADRRRDPDVQTAPPQGLFLGKVFYSDAAWPDYTPVLPPHHAAREKFS